jgi:proline dehydrogenase
MDRVIVRLLPTVPRPVVQRLSSPYIAGATLDDARRTVAGLNAEGKLATVDVLGEEVTRAADAEAVASAYHSVLDAIAGDQLDANVSVKLTALGLKVDLDLCRSLLATVVADAAARGIFVRIDMEDSTCTDDTLELYRELRAARRDNVGIVLQACLRRSQADVAALAALRPSVRLCKGIYVEHPSIAYQGRDEIRESFVRILDALLAAGCHSAVATHDEWLLERSLERLAGLRRDEYELQMLLGVRERRGSELVAAGHRLRVYVPYGDRWYEYSLRRLQENPALASMLARATLARLLPGR